MVIDERHRAVRAAQHLTAVPAHHEGRKSPSVEEEHRLLAAFEALAQRVEQALAEGRAPAHERLPAQVHDLYFGQRPAVDALGQRAELEIIFVFAGEVALDGRRRAAKN